MIAYKREVSVSSSKAWLTSVISGSMLNEYILKLKDVYFGKIFTREPREYRMRLHRVFATDRLGHLEKKRNMFCLFLLVEKEEKDYGLLRFDSYTG